MHNYPQEVRGGEYWGSDEGCYQCRELCHHHRLPCSQRGGGEYWGLGVFLMHYYLQEVRRGEYWGFR